MKINSYHGIDYSGLSSFLQYPPVRLYEKNAGKNLKRRFLLWKWNIPRKHDCIHASLPRSGTNWFLIMWLTLMSEIHETDWKLEFTGKPETLKIKNRDLWMGAFDKINDSFHFDIEKLPRLMTTHSHYWRAYRNRRVVLQIRNPINAYYSLYKYNSNRKSFKGSFHNFFESSKNIESISFFFNSWYQNLEKLKDVYILKYESLKNDTLDQMINIARFIGDIDVEKKLVQKIIEKSSMSVIQKAEKNYLGHKQVDNMFRARVGKLSYKEEMTEEIYEKIVRYFNDNLIDHFGYKLS